MEGVVNCLTNIYILLSLFSSLLYAFPDEFMMPVGISTKASNPNVVDILKKDFPDFYDLVQKAGMLQTLKDMSPVTLLVPAWYAFRKVSTNFLDSIAQDRIRLKNLVGMHILQGSLPSFNLRELNAAQTLNTPIYLQIDGSGSLFVTPSVTKSKVVAVDIPASNGVIHVIDSIIIPDNVRRIARQYEKN